ncbi:MAG: SRPBCC family protein [Sphingomicrobium sp.]
MPDTKDHETSGRQRALIGAGIAAAAAGAAFVINRKMKADGEEPISDAPEWTFRKRVEGEEGPLTGRSVTINRPRQEVYARWRDFTAFPQFMDNVRSVEKIDDKNSRWTIEAPAGTSVELVTEITADEPGSRIAWKSTEESQIATTGEVLFEDAAPGRGTVVRLVQSYAPPAGVIGKAVAKLFQREPYVQARRDLRRFKQLLETGEVTTNASPSGRTSESPTKARI